MKFREFTTEDYEYLKDHSASRGIFKNTPAVTEYNYSLEHDGQLLASGGFRLINTTTSWCWLDMTHHAGGHILTVYRVIKEWTDEFVRDHGILRLQAYVDPDFPEAIHMIQHLGFERESNMKNFYPNRDAYLYVRFT
jgi:RimJ/RimL family protein N-acetyltransferase